MQNLIGWAFEKVGSILKFALEGALLFWGKSNASIAVQKRDLPNLWQ